MQDELIQSAAVDSLSSTPETPPAVRGSMYLEPRERTVLAMIEAAAAVGHRAPKNAQISAALGVSRMMGSYYVTRLEQLGLISVERFARSRIITITATGQKTTGPEHKNSSAASGELPRAPEPNGVVQGVSHHSSFAPPLHQGTIVQRDNSDLPSDETDARAATASTSQAVNPDGCVSPTTPPEVVPGGMPPAVLSMDGRAWRAGKYSGMTSAPISIERARMMKKMASRPQHYRFTAEDLCQWYDGDGPFVQCASGRFVEHHPQNPYCAHHAARCGAGYTGPKLLGASNHDRKARA